MNILWDRERGVELVSLDSVIAETLERVPMWSADGQKLAYLRETKTWRGPVEDIVIVDRNGRELASTDRLQRTFPGVKQSQIRNFTWSPDGKRIVFIYTDEATYEVIRKFQLAVWNVETDAIEVPCIPVSVSSLAWSPDSRYIAIAQHWRDIDGKYHTLLWDTEEGWVVNWFEDQLRVLYWR